jgi:predicted dehydrogenase
MKRVAVVGFGFMGMTHALNILKNPNLTLTAIVDKYPETIEKNLTSKTGNFSTGNIDPSALKNISIYSDFNECIEKEDFDSVHICVHTDLHYTLAKKALLHDKNVFLEKPFCLNIKEGEELVNLAEERKKKLMVGHVVRFMSPYQKLKNWIDSREFGDLKFLSLSRFSGVPAWGQWKDKNVRGTSGGALFDLVIHDIDFASYILGVPAEIKCSYLPGALSEHDYISAMWSYNGQNVHVKIEGGNTFPENFPFQAGYVARFENACVIYNTKRGDIIQIADDSSVREVSAGDAGEGYYDEIDYFAQCVENNQQPVECMPSSSLQSIQLCYNHIERL